MIKNIVIILETVCIIVLFIVCINFYNRLPAEVIEIDENEKLNAQENLQNENLLNKTENEEVSKQMDNEYGNNTENATIEMKEGTYINTDDPEAHFLTLENGKAEAETYGTCVGTYTIENNKVHVIYTEEYDPDGNPCELEITEEIYRIEGDTLVQEAPYKMVYRLQEK